MSGRFSIDEILRHALFADPSGRHEGANLVDALFAIATSLNGVSNAIRALGNGDAAPDATAPAAGTLPAEGAAP
jgi:hypothetical protein